MAAIMASSQPRNHAFVDRPRRCDAQRMAVQASFAKKVARSDDCITASLPCLETT
jgi:hypothetical protein